MKYVLLFCSALMLFGAVPSLVVGAMDTANRWLFILIAALTIPQILGCWWATWEAWREMK